MQRKDEILQKTAAEILYKERISRGIKYTYLCEGYDIPTSTYDNFMNASKKTAFTTVMNIVFGTMDIVEWAQLFKSKLLENGYFDIED